jgi:hypothetical protein
MLCVSGDVTCIKTIKYYILFQIVDSENMKPDLNSRHMNQNLQNAAHLLFCYPN